MERRNFSETPTSSKITKEDASYREGEVATVSKNRYLKGDDKEGSESAAKVVFPSKAMEGQNSSETPTSSKITKKAASCRGERFEDVFQEEIIKAFCNITSFQRFARSKDGLCLDQSVINTIAEVYRASVEGQKLQTLFKWKEVQGEEATVSKIRYILQRYLKGDDKGERFEDVFEDEIIMPFVDITSFKRFARSKIGLCLDDHILQQIVEDHGDNLEEQKLQMLNKWREITGKEAKISKIRYLLRRYLREDDKGEYIVLENGIFGMYKNHVLCKRAHVFLGEQTSKVTGSYICAIKLRPLNKENLREAKIMSKLRNHVNVVSILHAGIYSSDPYDYIYLAMELSWTNTVRNMLEDSDRLGIPFNEFIAMNLVTQILRALDFIHSNNIIHRDLKPENVLLSKDWSQSKVTDFGISKTITDGHSTRQTNANIGTDGYRAGETYFTSAMISLKSDIFSAGVTIAEICSNGKHPFGEDQYLWSHNIINDSNLDLSHLLVPQILNLIKRMLQMDPEKRPTAERVLKEVQQFLISSLPKNQQTTAEQSSATSSMMQLQRPTAEKVLNEVQQFQISSQPKNQQTAAEQSSATSSMMQLHRSTAEKVWTKVRQFKAWWKPKNQKTTADQSSATSSMTQLQLPTAEEVQQFQTSCQPKNQQTTADQCSASAPMAELSIKEKANTIIMFDWSDKLMYSFKAKERSPMQECDIDSYFGTAVVSGRYMYILQNQEVYQLEYSGPTAKWKQMSSMREDHGEYPSVAELNGFIYVCGGSGISDASQSLERYDAALDRWDRMCDMNMRRTYSCVVASEGHIYCVGGRDRVSVERFDGRINRWEFVESLPRSINEASVDVAKNRIYVADHEGVLCYDILANSWSKMKTNEWSFVKGWLVKILAVNEELYVIGRIPGSSSNTAIYLLEPENGQMTLIEEFKGENLNLHASLAVKL